MIKDVILSAKAGCSAVYLALSLVFMLTHPAQASVELTPAEQAWLQANPEIRIGLRLSPPYMSILDDNNQLTGLAIDYIEALEQQLGIDFTRVQRDTYGQLIELAKQRSIDLIYSAAPTLERSEYLSFTEPYTFYENRIFVRKGEYPSATMESFSGLRFAVSGKTAMAEYIRTNYPQIQLVEAATLAEALSWLGSGFVDGTGVNVSKAYAYSQQKGIANIEVGARVGFDYSLSIGIRNDRPQLVSIINKAFDAIPLSQRRAIDRRWLAPLDPNKIDRKTVKEWVYTGLFIGAILLVVVLVWWNRSLKKEIAQRQLVEQKLSYLAYHDEMTGLRNRAGFLHTLKEAAPQQRRYLMLLLDLDHFRVKNDLWGQATGDEILKGLARRLQHHMVTDGIVARTGGDSFACLVPMGSESVDEIAGDVIELVNKPFVMHDGMVQTVTATLGMDELSHLSLRQGQPFEHAEIALKHGKREGRGGYYRYREDMSHDMGEDEQWKAALRVAIDHNQLFLEYQPQLDLENRRVLGFEALVRWQHPDKGRISPAEFIPYAERLGLIVDLGDWVMNTACQQAQAWWDQGLDFDRIAVNVSLKQFTGGDFSSRVNAALASTGLAPERLELEITETFLLGEFDQVREVMNRLAEQGVHFSIDDFGTGFSSMLYLKQLPVETIKVAQEFVMDIGRDSGSYEIVRASTQLGKSLGMNVIAEGIEDRDTQRILLDLGCTWAQGYYYSKPLKAELITPQLCQQWLDQGAEVMQKSVA